MVNQLPLLFYFKTVLQTTGNGGSDDIRAIAAQRVEYLAKLTIDQIERFH
jgi:hypothetical protein